MFISPEQIVVILEHYKYFLIFPIATIEGPIIIIISGFLVSLGFLNGFITYSILITAEIVGDILRYFVGVYWRRSYWIKKYGHFLGYDEKSEIFLESHFQRHKFKTLLITKFTYGFGTATQIAAGIARVSFYEFLWFSIITSIPKTLILFAIGSYAGKYYVEIDNFLDFVAKLSLFFILLIFVYFLFNKYMKNFLEKD